jgi:adenylate cyclase
MKPSFLDRPVVMTQPVSDSTNCMQPLAVLMRAHKAVLVMDVVESVRLMAQDEAAWMTHWQVLVQQAHVQVHANGGRWIKSVGDGFVAEFEHSHAAVATAAALHQYMEPLNAQLSPTKQLWWRAGVHACLVYVSASDVLGHGVNLAARVAGLAGPGQSVITQAAYDELLDGVDGEIQDLGLCYLKHLEEPVRLYRLKPLGGKSMAFMPDRLHDVRPRLAVVPFECRGDVLQASGEVIGDLIADGVLACLGRSTHLQVISRFSTASVRQRPAHAAQLLRQLQADYVLCGTCTHVAERLLLSFELTALHSDRLVVSERLSATLDDLLNVHSQACAFIANATHQALLDTLAAEALQGPMPTLPGHALLLAGIGLMHRAAPDDFQKSQQTMQALIERHPRAAASRSWMAKWYVLNLTRGLSTDASHEAQLALAQTRSALEIEPGNSLAMAMEGFVHLHLRHDLVAASGSLQCALQCNPNDPWVWLFMGVLKAFGDDGVGAVQCSNTALLLSPTDPMRYYFLSLAATCALSNQDFQKALILCHNSLKINRLHASTWRSLIAAHVGLDQLSEAKHCAQELLKISPGYSLQKFRLNSASMQSAGGQRVHDALQLAGISET